MISSIRTFLLVNLLLTVTISTSLAIIGNLFLEHKDFQTQLDSQLILSAYTIQAFLEENQSDTRLSKIQGNIDNLPNLFSEINYDIDHKFASLNALVESIQFQVWNHNKELLIKSYAAPNVFMASPKSGFDLVWFKNMPWRTFSLINDKKKINIVVMQNHDYRISLEKQISEDSITIMIIIYPFLGLLIWFIVGKGLQSLKVAENEIKSRDPNRLSPLNISSAPDEIIPLLKEINRLFKRLSEAFFREKRFASDAAHELRTPLAVLSTQAQVALQSKNNEVRDNAVKNLIKGVNRSTHVVQQLLTLSRMIPDKEISEMKKNNLKDIATEVISELVPKAMKKNINIELIADDKKYILNCIDTAISILIRNLIENAIKYSYEDSYVKVILKKKNKKLTLLVIDNGPGVSDELKDRIFERFYRVIGSKESGSGLGLSIVTQIIEVHQAKISIEDNKESNSGLVVKCIFNAV